MEAGSGNGKVTATEFEAAIQAIEARLDAIQTAIEGIEGGGGGGSLETLERLQLQTRNAVRQTRNSVRTTEGYTLEIRDMIQSIIDNGLDVNQGGGGGKPPK